MGPHLPGKKTIWQYSPNRHGSQTSASGFIVPFAVGSSHAGSRMGGGGRRGAYGQVLDQGEEADEDEDVADAVNVLAREPRRRRQDVAEQGQARRLDQRLVQVGPARQQVLDGGLLTHGRGRRRGD